MNRLFPYLENICYNALIGNELQKINIKKRICHRVLMMLAVRSLTDRYYTICKFCIGYLD